MENIIKKTNKFGKIKFFFKEAKILSARQDDRFSSMLFPEKLSENKKVCGGARYNGHFKNSLNGFPLISIVMPNFKEKNISKSIDSILNQNYSNIELIIIDGNSGDETINIFKEYGDEIDIWVSEKDKNRWDAWNKGFVLARGDFVGIVDSSNILYPNSLDILKKYIFENIDMDFLCGTVKKDNKIYAGFRPEDISRQFNIIPSTVVGFYIRSTSLRKVGLLNINYKIQSDYDWLYRIIVTNKMKGIRTKSDEVFGDLGSSNFSSKVSFFSALINELKIRLHNKQSTGAILFIFFGRITLNFYKKIMKIFKFKK